MTSKKAYSQELAEQYDQRHFGGKSGHYILQKDYAAISALLPTPPALILDVPCGTGIYTHSLIKAGFDVIAADASAPMLEITAKRTTGVKTKLCSIQELPFDDNTFDATMTLRLFSHFSQDETLLGLRELRRVIKPGGVIIFDSFRWTPRRWPVIRNVTAQSYIHEMAPSAVKQLLQLTDLRVVSTETSYLFSPIWQRKLPYPVLKALTSLETRLPDRWLLRTFWACTKST